MLLERREVQLTLLLMLLEVILALRRARELALLHASQTAKVKPIERHPLVEPPVVTLIVHVVVPLTGVLILLAFDDFARLKDPVTTLT